MYRVAAVSFAFLFIGCGPKIKSYEYIDLPPLPSDHEVVVFSDSLPECSYQQVGLIASDDMRRTLNRARDIGADGVIGTVEAGGDSSDPKTAICGTPQCVTFNTVAIRFTDPDCRH